MVRWATAHRPRRILDPALGPGVFVHAVDSLYAAGHLPASATVDACEIDPRMIAVFEASRGDAGADAAASPRSRTRTRRSPSLRVHAGDFLHAALPADFDAIICNPPYVRHHELRYPADMLGAFDRQIGGRLSRFTNLYALFLLRIWSLLGPGGRAAVITPAEWLNADFGVALKDYLLRENALDALLQFDPAAAIFDGVLTTAAITLLRRGRAADERIAFQRVRSLDDLDAANPTAFARTELDPRQKWSPLFLAGRTKSRRGEVPLGQLARCVRGIATGANNYFVLRPSDLARWGIDRRDVCPCITKATQVRNDRLTRDDVRRLEADDQRLFLLMPRRPLSAAVERYLDHGRRAGIDRRYLPSHRPVWYLPERRDPAPIWVNVFARGGFRFVRNEAGVLHLTAFHAIYPRDGVDPDRLHAALQRAASDGAMHAQQRHYAAGLQKLEPRDVERIPIRWDAGGAPP